MMKTLSVVDQLPPRCSAAFMLFHDGGGESAADAVTPSNSYRLVANGDEGDCAVTRGAAVSDGLSLLTVAPNCRRLLPGIERAKFWREEQDGTVAFSANGIDPDSSPSRLPTATATNPTRRPRHCCRWRRRGDLNGLIIPPRRAHRLSPAACRRTASPKARKILTELLSDLTQYSGCHCTPTAKARASLHRNRLDRAVAGDRLDLQFRAEPVDRLAVHRIDHDVAGAEHAGQAAAGLDRNVLADARSVRPDCRSPARGGRANPRAPGSRWPACRPAPRSSPGCRGRWRAAARRARWPCGSAAAWWRRAPGHRGRWPRWRRRHRARGARSISSR